MTVSYKKIVDMKDHVQYLTVSLTEQNKANNLKKISLRFC